MTLGNGPQPLTRRQLRELARENEPVSAETEPAGVPVSAAPAPDAPAPDAPAADAKNAHHSRHTSPPHQAPAAAAKPAPAPLPIPHEEPSANAVVIDSVVVEPSHNLTRRELRALQVAAAASAEPAEEVDADSRAAAGTPGPEAASAPADAAVTFGVTPVGAGTGDSTTGASTTGLNPPLGHWSVDRDDDSHIQSIGRRDDQTFDDLVGSGMGAGGIPTTTNALVLPAIPRQGTAGPITSTGEIMITGSIDLPRSLGATGQHPNLFDSSEMDRMLDQLDEGGHHNDVAPVSASRAVSTHTSTRGVMTPPRKRGASLPTVLAITAAVLAIGVLSLFVVGYAFNIY